MLQYAIQFLERALELGGRAAFEPPAENALWKNQHLVAFEERAGMKRVYFHGCPLTLKGKGKGKSMSKNGKGSHNKSGSSSAAVICFNCGKPGHVQRDRRAPKQNNNSSSNKGK